MKKILLYKQKKYPLQDFEYKDLIEFFKDPNKDSQFEFRGQWLTTRFCEILDEEQHTFQVDRFYTDEQIKDFEKELEEAKKEPLIKNLEFYGKPVLEYKIMFGAERGTTKKLPTNTVENEILGLAFAQLVQYCLKNKIISRKETKDFRGNNIVEWRVYANTYGQFLEKKNALDNLILRRNYAQKMNDEELVSLTEAEINLVDKIKF